MTKNSDRDKAGPPNAPGVQEAEGDIQQMSLQSNFTPRMSRLRLARIETTDKTKPPWGVFTDRYLQSTKALVLLGFSIMHTF